MQLKSFPVWSFLEWLALLKKVYKIWKKNATDPFWRNHFSEIQHVNYLLFDFLFDDSFYCTRISVPFGDITLHCSFSSDETLNTRRKENCPIKWMAFSYRLIKWIWFHSLKCLLKRKWLFCSNKYVLCSTLKQFRILKCFKGNKL